MCCPRPGAEFRRVLSELAACPAKANSQPGKTIFCDQAALIQDAVIAVMERAPRAKLVPRIRWVGQTARLGCWSARESSRYPAPDSARVRPRNVHEEWLRCAAQDFRWRLTGWVVRPVLWDLAARHTKLNSQTRETISCVARALPRENVVAEFAPVAERPNRRWREVPGRLLRRKSNSRFRCGYHRRGQGTAGQPLSSIH